MTYRLFGAELSPYSVKVRSYLRYRGVPHQWIVRDQRTNKEFQKFAQLPLIPALVAPDGTAEQDSTPIILRLEREKEMLRPPGAVAPFISALLEEYADEWANKWMFHYRWHYAENADSAAWRLADMMLPPAFWARLPVVRQLLKKKIAPVVKERMTGRLFFVGSSEKTKGHIEGSFLNACALLEAHLAQRPYLFGGMPSLGDFGLWCQLYILWGDPMPKRIINSHPAVAAFVRRGLSPKKEGEWEAWDAVAPTLMPLLLSEVGQLFLPWSKANAKALQAGEKEFSVLLGGASASAEFSQQTQKYHARSLGVLIALYQQQKNPALDAVLEQAGCLALLNSE